MNGDGLLRLPWDNRRVSQSLGTSSLHFPGDLFSEGQRTRLFPYHFSFPVSLPIIIYVFCLFCCCFSFSSSAIVGASRGYLIVNPWSQTDASRKFGEKITLLIPGTCSGTTQEVLHGILTPTAVREMVRPRPSSSNRTICARRGETAHQHRPRNVH